jgi:hypothetical protein
VRADSPSDIPPDPPRTPGLHAGVLCHDALTCAVDQTQFAVAVEGKDGNFDLGHHRSKQRTGFHSAQALFLQHL